MFFSKISIKTQDSLKSFTNHSEKTKNKVWQMRQCQAEDGQVPGTE
jgi:hypothetical protein